VVCFFFFQAEDGIRDFHVTGVQTCALPILVNFDLSRSDVERSFRVLETYAGVASNNGYTTLQASLDPGRLYYNYVLGQTFDDPGTLVLTDAGGWGQDGYLKDFGVNDRIRAVRLNAIRSFENGFISAVDFGANHSKRTKDKAS